MSGRAASGDSPQLRVFLLGGFRVERADGVPVPSRWRRGAAQTLVKLLAVAPGLRRHREQVMDLLWPDTPPDAAVRNLRVVLHAARHALEPDLAPRTPSSFLLGDGELLLLAPGRVWVDADEAEASARTALAEGDVAALAAARSALGRELLPEDRYAEWAEQRRGELVVLRDRLVPAQARRLLSAARTSDAVDVLRSALEDSPADERLGLLLARMLVDAGQPRQAIRQYHASREALADELGVRPGPDFEDVHRAALSALDRRPLPSATRQPTVLPAAIRRREPHPLVGRERPLSLLIEHATTTVGSPLVVVRGEAGIGKTCLVAEAARAAAGVGVTVLWGSGHDAEGHTPYGMFADALEGRLAQCDPAERARVGAEHAGLAALVPSLGGAPPVAGPEEERARLFRAVSGFLTDLAGGAPALVVLDDLHDADPGSLSLLHHLVRGAQTRPWRFIATYRDDELTQDAPAAQTLGGLLRRGAAVEVDLLRLGRADCAALSAAVSGPEPDARTARRAQHRIYRLSLGNPLFALELARSGVTADPGTAAAPAGNEVPSGIRHLVSERLAALPEPARQILGALSMATGTSVSLTELEEVAATGLHPPLAPGQVAAALGSASEAGIVEEREVVLGGRTVLGYAFRHPLVRLACAERQSGAIRRRLHRAHADTVLRVRPDAVDLIAAHMTAADHPRAHEFLRAAAERAATLFANDSACGYYADLVSRLDGPEAAAARLAWGEVLRRAARFHEAETVLRQALAHYVQAQDASGTLRAAASLAEALGRAGRPLDGLAVLNEVARFETHGTPEDRAAHRMARGALCFNAGRYEAALAALRRAETYLGAPGADHQALLSRLFTIRAACLMATDRTQHARAAADEALLAADASGDAARLSGALSVVGELARADGRWEVARDCARRAVGLARRTGDPAVMAFDQGNLAVAELRVGALHRATSLAESAVRVARSLEESWVLPYALVALAEVHVGCARYDGARKTLDACERAVARTDDPQVRAGLRRVRLELAAITHGGEAERGNGRVMPAD
ncbi:ATP-binding protein [Streptomyces yanii]|uniref:AAA family ATPase n=1 Tax=Streptomyces yanii TaxID=78510 RepID=A0ABV5R4I3_9ACTN